MSIRIRIFAILLLLIYFYVIIKLLRKQKLALKYSLVWIFSWILMLIVSIYPNILDIFARLLKIKVASNGLFALCIFTAFAIMLSLTVVISDFANRIKSIVQRLSIMENRIRKLESKSNEDEQNTNI